MPHLHNHINQWCVDEQRDPADNGKKSNSPAHLAAGLDLSYSAISSDYFQRQTMAHDEQNCH